MCKSCNIDEGYYPISNDIIRTDGFINCYKNPEGFYLNNQAYEECYSTCKFCTEFGNEIDNKCIECISTHEMKNDFVNDKNCYEKCTYNYYYDSSNNYHCTNKDCPSEYNKLIEDKKRCIDDCKNDNKYQYEYQNKCYQSCPLGTQPSLNNTYICEKITEEENGEEEECKLRIKELYLTNKEISVDNINSLTVNYKNEYGDSNNYVSQQENKYYKIYIYKNLTCLKNTSDEANQIDFGECYENIKNTFDIHDNLIITLINKKNEEKSNPSTSFYFSNPLNGKILNVSEICANDIIVIQKDLLSLMGELDEKKEELIIYLMKQGIDVFNISDEFYNDLCYHYESPNGKDVPLKDRVSEIYPNITLCDKGCENKGFDLETMKAKCECIFSNLMNNDLMNNFYGQAIVEAMDIISSLNLSVMKCIKDIFDKEQFLKCTGGFIIIGLFAGQLICIFKFVFDGIYTIRKYIFSLSETFNIYLNNHINVNSPPKKKKTFRIISSQNLIKNDSNSIQSSEHPINIQNNFLRKKKSRTFKEQKTNTNNPSICKLKSNKSIQRKSMRLYKINNININLKTQNSDNNNHEINKMKDFLSNSFDEEDLDEVIDKDKRTFCQYFCENFQNNQIFINAFCMVEKMKPRVLKIIILIITIELYFVITALFYNEEYLSELFNSSEEDNFFSFVPRRINQFIYTSTVSGIISYLIGYFFVEEGKLKRIFIRNKEESLKMKYEISLLVKGIEKKFIILNFFSIFLSMICFVYISCFNIVYPYIRGEWIKSSLFILILMQILNFLITFAHCCLRYLAIKYNSTKIFKLSLWFS